MFVPHISPFSVHFPLSDSRPLPVSAPLSLLSLPFLPPSVPSASVLLPSFPSLPPLGRAPAGNMLPVRDGPVKSALLSPSLLFFCPGTNILFVFEHSANNTRDLFYCSHSKESLIFRCIADCLRDATGIKSIKSLHS